MSSRQGNRRDMGAGGTMAFSGRVAHTAERREFPQ